MRSTDRYHPHPDKTYLHPGERNCIGKRLFTLDKKKKNYAGITINVSIDSVSHVSPNRVSFVAINRYTSVRIYGYTWYC